MKLRVLAALAWVPAALSLSTPAAAQFAKPEDAIRYRQSALFVLGQHFTRLGAMANGRVPFDAKLAQENADVVAAMARLPWAAFELARAQMSGGGSEVPAPAECRTVCIR